jgi:hypothetical protein
MRDMPISFHVGSYPSLGIAYDSALLAFHHVGVDILGPFPRVGGGYHFLCVAIDKFTKWLEATTVTTI